MISLREEKKTNDNSARFDGLFSLNSADSTPRTLSTTPSDDEDDIHEHHQFLTPTSDSRSLTNNSGVVVPHATVNIHDHQNDSTHLDDDTSYEIISSVPQTTTPKTVTISPLDTYLNLSEINSETSLGQSLLADQHQTSPNNHEDERTTSSAASTTSTTSSSSSTLPNYRSYITLYFTDMLISAFIITPFLNIHWRGAWDILDIHLLPDSPCTSALISLGIGYFMLYTFYLTQGYLQRFYERNRHNIMGQIMTRLYTLTLALAYVQQWRGLWNLLDLTSNLPFHLLGEATVSIVFLLLLKSIYNLNSAPFLIGIDTDSYFLLDSKYTVTVSHFLCMSLSRSHLLSRFRRIISCNIHSISCTTKLSKLRC